MTSNRCIFLFQCVIQFSKQFTHNERWRALHYILLILWLSFHWFVLSLFHSFIHSSTFPTQCSFHIFFSCFVTMNATTTIYLCKSHQNQTNGIVMRIAANDFYCEIGKIFYCSGSKSNTNTTKLVSILLTICICVIYFFHQMLFLYCGWNADTK